MDNNIFLCNYNNIKDILTCPICLDYYDDARNLFCGHSYCISCLHIININNRIICPTCRSINPLYNLSVKELPINSSLCSLIDIKNNINISKKIRRTKSTLCLYQNSNKRILRKSKSVDCLSINNSKKYTYTDTSSIIYYNDLHTNILDTNNNNSYIHSNNNNNYIYNNDTDNNEIDSDVCCFQ